MLEEDNIFFTGYFKKWNNMWRVLHKLQLQYYMLLLICIKEKFLYIEGNIIRETDWSLV